MIRGSISLLRGTPTCRLLIAIVLVTLGAGLILASAQVTPSPRQSEPSGGSQTFSGVISDSVCKAKHDTRMGQSAAGCTKVCLRKGAKFALVDGDRVFFLRGATEYLDRYAGQRVMILGRLQGNIITVSRVEGGQP
jgi:hypothetical protein